MKRFLWLGFVLFVYVIGTGCGDTFRPIIIPNPPTFPDPRAAHTVVSINDNGSFTAGSTMVIDVAGDANVSVADVDIHPVHAVQQTANQVLVVNQAATHLDQPALPVPTTSCLVTYPPPPAAGNVYNVCPSLEKLDFNGTVIAAKSSISLPPYAGSNFVATAPASTLAFVTMPTYPPDPTNPAAIVPSVGVVNTSSNTLANIVPVVTSPPVNANPYALAVTPNNLKLYVANNSTPCGAATPGICSISAFDINAANQTLTTRAVSGSLSNPPIWLVARTDNQRVYVLEGNAGGTQSALASLDTTATAGPDLLTEYLGISVPGATLMVYDSNLNRLYIPGGSEVAIVDVSQSSPQYLAGGPISIPAVLPGLRAASDPCFTTTAQTLKVGAAAALPDGSRAYVGAYYEAAVNAVNFICPQVTVINAASNTIKSSIALPGFPAYDAFCAPSSSQPSARFRIMMSAAGDSSAAYLSSCDAGSVNIIDTTTDTYSNTLLEPVGSRMPIPPSTLNPPQNPVFIFAGP